MNENFILNGPPPLIPIPKISLGKFILQQFIKKPKNQIAILDVYTKTTLTYGEILEKSQKLAAFLRREKNIQKNSKISICSENSPYYILPVISGLFLETTTALISYHATINELKHYLGISEPDIIFCSKSTHKKILDTKLLGAKDIIIIDDILDNLPENLDNFQINDHTNPVDDVAFILYSSGTTGPSKGVMLTHQNCLIRFLQNIDPRVYLLPENVSTLIIAPLFHIYGLLTLLANLMTNNKVLLLKHYEERIFLEIIEKEKVGVLWLVPTLVVSMIKSDLLVNYDLSGLKIIYCGATTLDKDMEKLLCERLPHVTLRQNYGLTESSLCITCVPPGAPLNGSVGNVVRYMQSKICDVETQQILGPNQIGELYFKGPMIMKGYKNNPVATKATITQDGWLITGDLGYYDENQSIYIVGRLKEIMKYKGYQVVPSEIEAVLLTHPDIIDAGVVGKPDEIAGELPTAFIVKKFGSNLNEKAIQDYVARQLSFQKHLRGGVIFVGHIPKNPSGKILRNELKKMLNGN